MRVRLRTHAFQAMIATNSIVAGVLGIFSLSEASLALRALLPIELAVFLDASYAVAGAMILAGMLNRRVPFETPGLFLLGSAAGIRVIADAWALGVAEDTGHFTSVVYHLCIMLAAGGRIHSLLLGETIVARTANGR